MKATVPYEKARKGAAVRGDIVRMLKQFGCESVGFMDDFDRHEVILAFRHRGRPVQLRASAKGWAELYLRTKPWRPNMRLSQEEYEQQALKQGLVAVNSILRDWVKGQITAVECGILSFEAVFMPYMITNDGRSLIERVQEANLLPPPSA